MIGFITYIIVIKIKNFHSYFSSKNKSISKKYEYGD